jgi:hypothetical protein
MKTISEAQRKQILIAHDGRRKQAEAYFWHRVRKTRGCWIWTGCTNNGYGYIGRSKAHRRMYTMMIGPIPDGYHIHHTCGTKLCVKPVHLVAMSEQDHIDEHPGRGWW